MVSLILSRSILSQVKKNIHPAYHDITFVMTDGTLLRTRSTSNEKKQTLSVDPKSHVAWTKVQHFSDKGRRSRYQSQYSGLSFGK